MGWLQDVITWLFKSRSPQDMKTIQEIYRTAITDLKEKLAEQQKVIESYKGRVTNGKEMTEWQHRETELGQQLLHYMNKCRELETQLHFANKEIERLNKKK